MARLTCESREASDRARSPSSFRWPSPQNRPRRKAEPEIQSIARNKRARYDYHILETWEAGIVLDGHRGQVAARRPGQHQRRLRDRQGRGGLPPQPPHLAVRARRLHEPRARPDPQAVAPPQGNPSFDWGRRARRDSRSSRSSSTSRTGVAKVALALGKGKQLHDKRETERTRDAEREMARVVRTR